MKILLKLYATYVIFGLLVIGVFEFANFNPTNQGTNNKQRRNMINLSQNQSYPDLIQNQVGINCKSDYDCNHGNCVRKFDVNNNPLDYTQCECDSNYIDDGGEPCAYEERPKLVAFLLSFFTGGLGVDWFYLSRGNAGYIVAGVFKMISCGGCGIWWLVDWIRILTDTFPDGNGYPLGPW